MVCMKMSRVLCQPRTDRHRSLDTAQERRTVDDDLVPPLPQISIRLVPIICCKYLIVCLPGSQNACNARPKGSRLVPTAIGERRIVRSR
jgi:hypothetical protein